MSYWLVSIIGVLYLGQALWSLKQGNYAETIVWSCYGTANFGLILGFNR